MLALRYQQAQRPLFPAVSGRTADGWGLRPGMLLWGSPLGDLKVSSPSRCALRVAPEEHARAPTQRTDSLPTFHYWDVDAPCGAHGILRLRSLSLAPLRRTYRQHCLAATACHPERNERSEWIEGSPPWRRPRHIRGRHASYGAQPSQPSPAGRWPCDCTDAPPHAPVGDISEGLSRKVRGAARTSRVVTP